MSKILRSVSLATLTILLCGLMLTSAYAQKTPKTPKTPKTQEQIEKFQANHPSAGTVATAKKTPVAWQAPASRPGGGNAPSSNYNSGQSNGNRPTTIDDDRRNGNGRNGDGRNGDGRDNGRYEYVGRPSDSGRAYEIPRHDECDRNCRRDDHHHSWNPGRSNPAPIRIYLPQRPVYIPAPAPRYGGTPGYYPQAYAPFSAPDCGDINRMPLLGSEIIAADGTFLGIIDRDYDNPESIANARSAFGSPYSRLSIWNPESAYGSPNGAYSPWNRNCYRPPVLYWHGVFRGYLSTNPDMQPKVSPSSLPEHLRISAWR
jgi:hypothetical protein